MSRVTLKASLVAVVVVVLATAQTVTLATSTLSLTSSYNVVPPTYINNIHKQWSSAAFLQTQQKPVEHERRRRRQNCRDTWISVLDATSKRNSKKGSSSSSSSIKGFGSIGGGSGSFGASTTTSSSLVEMDRSLQSRMFHEKFLQSPLSSTNTNSIRDTLKRTALAYYQLPTNNNPSSSTSSSEPPPLRLRGIVATRDIGKGEDIIAIPYEIAINLGPEGQDPTIPAMIFLRDYCTVLQNNDDKSSSSNTNAQQQQQRQHYYKMLPPFLGQDCLGCTDFYSDDALEALQSPRIVQETLQRRQQAQLRFQTDISIASEDPPLLFPIMEMEDGTTTTTTSTTPVTVQHLQWAVWIVTSRVLTVQADATSGGTSSCRLLIPYLDMCNHDRESVHTLTGRAIPGGLLRIVAGKTVKSGEPINIAYGAGTIGNQRFIQDYGFLDASVGGYRVAAQEIVGKIRIREGMDAGRFISPADQQRSIDALRQTTIAHDEELLRRYTTTNLPSDPALRMAIQYRLGVKRALTEFIEMP